MISVHKIRPRVSVVPWSLCVGSYVCVFVGHSGKPRKRDKPIQMPFLVRTRWGPREPCYGMVNVDLYSAIITKVSNALY